jgi:hypothetical protein
MYKVNYKGYEFNITQNEDGSFNIPSEIKDIEQLGTSLKPANEPICVARKPLSEKSVAENVLKWGTGGINIDGCRVNFNGDKPKECELVDFRGDGSQMNLNASGKERKTIEDRNYIPNDEGRFPANIILECLCDEVIKGEKGEVKKSGGTRENCDLSHEWGYDNIVRTNFTDKGDIHTNPMCPCYMLDEQSGVSKSSQGLIKGGIGVSDIIGANKKEGGSLIESVRGHNDKGGASRFFYQAKVSKAERNMSGKCSHPTLKPIQLMSYLCKLVTPPNGIVLDPFSGSGSTGIAALLNDFRFIGMELEQEYFDIMEKRVNDYESYRKFLKKV